MAAVPTRSPRRPEISAGVGAVANGQVDGVDTRHKRGGGASGTIISAVERSHDSDLGYSELSPWCFDLFTVMK